MEILRGLCSMATAQCQCHVLPCCAPDEPCECRECGCSESTSSRPFQAIITIVAAACVLISSLAVIFQRSPRSVVVYDGFTRTHDELVRTFNVPEQDAWSMHFAGECARAAVDPTITPMPLLHLDIAFELIIVLPHMWWQNVCGTLKETKGCGATRGLYWFSNHHNDDHNCTRNHKNAKGVPGYDKFNNGHPEERWIPPGPALKAHYRGFPPLLESQTPRKFFKSERGAVHVTISNIDAVLSDYNTLQQAEVDALVSAIEQAAKRRGRTAEILYMDDLMGTGDPIPPEKRITFDKNSKVAHGTQLYHRRKARFEENEAATTFQEVQLRLMAYSSCFVAPHGGANYATLLFGRPTILLNPTGEVIDRTNGIQFATTLPLLGGSRVIAVSNTTHMGEAIAELIETGQCD